MPPPPTYALGSNLENLTLTGSNAINGTGNTLDNFLVGNASGNTLTGNAGGDTLDGGGGTDSLVGGSGADVYRFGAGYGIDTISENDATAGVTDAVQFAGPVMQADVQYQQVGNNMEVTLSGTTDKIVLQNWYLGAQYQVEEFRFADGTVLTSGQAQGMVMAGAGAAALSGLRLADAAEMAANGDGRKQIHIVRPGDASAQGPYRTPVAPALLGAVLERILKAETSLTAGQRDASTQAWLALVGERSAVPATGRRPGDAVMSFPADDLPGNTYEAVDIAAGSPTFFGGVAARAARVVDEMALAAPSLGALADAADGDESANPEFAALGRKHRPRVADVPFEAIAPWTSETLLLGSLRGNSWQSMPDVLGSGPLADPTEVAPLARQAAALIEAMAHFGAPAGSIEPYRTAGGHLTLDKVTIPSLMS